MKISFIKSTDNDFCFVKDIRKRVFTEEQKADENGEFDIYDEAQSSSLYVLIISGDTAAATGRLAFFDSSCKIGRIAVLKEYRGRGFGDMLVRALVEKAFELGFATVYVDSQNYAVPFYERFGFEVIGGQIFDRGLAHMPMRLDKNNYR